MTEPVNKNELTIVDFLHKIKNWLNFIRRKILEIIVITLFFGLIGYFYAKNQKVIFSAKSTFVVEDPKSNASGLGGLASLAGQFGVDVGGANASSILSGDNILLYFKSPSLAREVLESNFDKSSSNTLADIYFKEYQLNEKWEEILPKNFAFYSKVKNSSFLRLRDSLLNEIVSDILKNRFSVSKTDKKASFIDIEISTTNEGLSKLYCERIVTCAVNRYLEVKTQRQKNTVFQLQNRLDSVTAILNSKTYSSLDIQTKNNTMDINPIYKTNNLVAYESTIRDKSMLATIYATVTQNLEMAKFTLSQETPVIQIIDSPNTPLKQIKVSKIKMVVIFSLFSALIYTLFITLYWGIRKYKFV